MTIESPTFIIRCDRCECEEHVDGTEFVGPTWGVEQATIEAMDWVCEEGNEVHYCPDCKDCRDEPLEEEDEDDDSSQ